MNHLERSAHDARAALYIAEKLLAEELKGISHQDVASPQKDQSLSGRDYKKINFNSQLTASVAKFKEVISKYPKTRAGFEAHMDLASLYFDHGDDFNALAWLQKAELLASDRQDQIAVYSAIGYAQENLSKSSEAVEAFQKAIRLGDKAQKGDLLLAVARCYEALHDMAKARSIYDQVSSEFSGSEYAKSAELLKSQL
jgi:tetratricopeptide (TPR) repeat protein